MKRPFLIFFSLVPLLLAQPPDPAALARAVSAYEFGQDRAPLDAMSGAVRLSYNEPAMKSKLEAALVQLLGGSATHAAKDYACRQLSLIGGDASVPALAALINDSKLGSIALYALERIPGKASSDALLKALPLSSGLTRTGIVNALARRGVSNPVYRKLLNDPDPLTSSAAAYAIAETGSAADIQALLAVRHSNSAARDAAVRLAGRLGAAGRPVYTALWASSEPLMARVAALEGLARLDGAKALPIVLEAAKSAEQTVQAEAIRLAARLGAHRQLLDALPSLSPSAQVRAITALSETGAVSALPAFRSAINSPDPAIRVAAIRALGRNGAPEDAGILARKAVDSEEEEREEARSALVRLKGAAADAAIVKAMPSADPKLKVELIKAASERGTQEAVPEILASARSTDRDVRREAYRALRDIAPASAAPALVTLLAQAPSAADRREMERALASTLRRNPQAPLAPLAQEYDASRSSDIKASLLSVMGQSARDDALPRLRAALALPEPSLRRAAILALTEWPTPAPAAELLNSARSDSEPALRILALRGYIKLVSTPSDRAPADVAAQLAEVLKLSPPPEEKKALLAALTRFICRESLEVAKSLAGDPAVAAEAKAAVERIERSLAFRR